MPKTSLSSILFVSVIISMAALLGVMYVVGSATFADALRGYEVMYQFSDGANWNTLNYPSVANPVYSYYVAWWTPGQWMIPWLIMSVFSIESTQAVQAILITICLPLALLGYGRLLTKLKFSKTIVFASLLCIVTNQLFYWHSIMYYGGDLLLLTFFPFFLLFLLRIKNENYFRSLLLFLLIGFIGVFFKNTFLLVLLGAITFLNARPSSLSKVRKIGFLIPTFIIGVIVLLFHISSGETPSSASDVIGYNGIPNDVVGDLTVALSSPFNSFFRYDSLVKFLFQTGGWGYAYFNYLLILPAILSMLFLRYLHKMKSDNSDYKLLLIQFSVPVFIVFTVMYLRDSAVSYDMRHFAPIAFLFIPGILSWILTFKWKKVIIAGVVILTLMDVGLYYRSQVDIALTHTEWKTMKLPTREVEVMELIENWTVKNPNGIVLIEDRWQLSVGMNKVNKVVIANNTESHKWFVNSGMELEKADQFNLADLQGLDCSAILFVSKKKNDMLSRDKMTVMMYNFVQSVSATADYELAEFVISTN